MYRKGRRTRSRGISTPLNHQPGREFYITIRSVIERFCRRLPRLRLAAYVHACVCLRGRQAGGSAHRLQTVIAASQAGDAPGTYLRRGRIGGIRPADGFIAGERDETAIWQLHHLRYCGRIEGVEIGDGDVGHLILLIIQLLVGIGRRSVQRSISDLVRISLEIRIAAVGSLGGQPEQQLFAAFGVAGRVMQKTLPIRRRGGRKPVERFGQLYTVGIYPGRNIRQVVPRAAGIVPPGGREPGRGEVEQHAVSSRHVPQPVRHRPQFRMAAVPHFCQLVGSSGEIEFPHRNNAEGAQFAVRGISLGTAHQHALRVMEVGVRWIFGNRYRTVDRHDCPVVSVG